VTRTIFIALSITTMLGACGIPESRTAAGVVASEEPRIWVVRTVSADGQVISEVYRCADGAAVDQPPMPVCVKAPMGE
jgi:hypothetical protein